MHLAGRAALLTGATRIGAAVATALAARGVDVAVTYNRSAHQAEATARAVRDLGRRAFALQADLVKPQVCRDVVSRTADEFGRLDILVAMASIYDRRLLGQTTVENWDEGLAVDLSSSFHCAHAAVPHLRAAGDGRIVLFSDWVAVSGRPRYKGYLPYYVAKTGVIALGEALALELAADGILVNTIAPGPILPAASMSAKENDAVVRATPVGRWGGPEAIASTVVAVLESDFMTGQTIRVDGGRHLQ